MIDQALYKALKALNLGGVFANVRGDDLPAVVYNLISAPRSITLSAQPEIMQSRYQVDCYGSSKAEVVNMASTIIRALHNKTRIDTLNVQRILLEDQRDRYEQKPEVFGQMLQFVIYHHESGD